MDHLIFLRTITRSINHVIYLAPLLSRARLDHKDRGYPLHKGIPGGGEFRDRIPEKRIYSHVSQLSLVLGENPKNPHLSVSTAPQKALSKTLCVTVIDDNHQKSSSELLEFHLRFTRCYRRKAIMAAKALA